MARERFHECTTLCYLIRDEKYLMLHRIKKRNDENQDKYIGVGGHLEKGETPEECVRREVLEETGLTMGKVKLRGLLTFVFERKDEFAWLYTCDDFTGEITDCDEGTLEWVPMNEIGNLPLWEGDKIFFDLMEKGEEYFSLKLVYDADNNFVEAKIM